MATKAELEGALAEALNEGRVLDAARVSAKLNRHGDAARLFEQAGAFLDAARSHRENGQVARALKAVQQIQKSDPRYVPSARLAIELAASVASVTHDLESFVEAYLEHSPDSAEDANAFFVLGQLYEATDYLPQATALYRRILAVHPEHEAAARLNIAEDSATRFATTEVQVSKADMRAVRELLRAPAPVVQPDASGFAIGAVLAGRYRLEQLLGIGAYASVFKAFDTELSERVALKLMNPFSQESLEQARFFREVSVARRLSHPNIVRIYDLGQHEKRHFFTMELLEGRDLASHIASAAFRTSLRRDLLLQALDGLAYAHAHGVVHRDIKPENLFVTSDAVLKVADFGMAKAAGSVNVTTAGSMGGTPHYMSPEQITDLTTADHRADLYALGAVAYELFTGRPPFDAQGLTDLLLMHISAVPKPMRSLRATLPEALDAVVLKLLAKSRDDRYQTAEEARTALARVEL